MEARKPFIYLAIIAIILAIIGIFILNNDFSGRVILKQDQSYSAEEISAHNSIENCWITSNNNVYDITMFLNAYDKESLKNSCGQDASIIINDFSENMKIILEDYKIGVLK